MDAMNEAREYTYSHPYPAYQYGRSPRQDSDIYQLALMDAWLAGYEARIRQE